MYKIIGQPINMRYLGRLHKSVQPIELNEKTLRLNQICEFGLKYGYKATVDAFGISKSTYYGYLKMYKQCAENGVLFEFKSTRPHNFRRAKWNKKVVNFIIKMRTDHANIGKNKIKYYLDEFCKKNGLACISTGTIQNIINSFAHKLRTKKSIVKAKRRETVLRKPKQYKASKSGECLALDSMEFRRDGKKLYVVVAVDDATNLMYAEATTSHTSRATTIILTNAHNYLPWENFTTILTDNGSEFAKDFSKYLIDNNVVHYHTYPKTPKQNARCERLNRIIQDEFMIKHGNLLFDDLHLFNRKLKAYLHWYNFKRVHARYSNKMTPFQRHLQLTSMV